MKNNTKKLAGIAMLTAIVAVLQLLGGGIKLGMFSISLVLIPIVVGASLYGVGAGAWLGLVFGAMVIATGDAALFMGINAIGTVITVLGKGVLAGLAAGLVYRLIEKKSKMGAVITSAIVCPVVNTGVFLVGCALFFMDAINGWAADAGQSPFIFMIVGLVGLNFIFELAVNLVLGPVIVRIVNIGKKQLR